MTWARSGAWVQGLGIPWTLLGCSCRFPGAGKIYWRYGVRGLAWVPPSTSLAGWCGRCTRRHARCQAEVVRAVVDVPVNMQLKLQQFLPIDIVGLRFSSSMECWTLQLCHRDRYARFEHAATSSSSPGANCAENREDYSVHFVGEVWTRPSLCNDRCRGCSGRCRGRQELYSQVTWHTLHN